MFGSERLFKASYLLRSDTCYMKSLYHHPVLLCFLLRPCELPKMHEIMRYVKNVI